jgi:hypothetical protein
MISAGEAGEFDEACLQQRSIVLRRRRQLVDRQLCARRQPLAALKPRSDHLPVLLNLILYRCVDVKGLQLEDYFHTYPEFLGETMPLVANGTIKYREDFVDGFEKDSREPDEAVQRQ